MSGDQESARELAYRFDLFIAPDWVERFDSIVAEHVTMPDEGRLLEINCGTGANALNLATSLPGTEVVGADAHGERVSIAREKANAARAERCTFVEADPERLGFETATFDGVLLDATLEEPDRLGSMVAEAVRVARHDAPIAVKIVLRGSFDEFFSIYWEALHELGLDASVWDELERIIVEHPSFEEAVATVRASGVRHVETHRTKEEWRFENGAAFFDAPLVADLFLGEWLGVVPVSRRADVRDAIVKVIDRERAGSYFDVSMKALVVAGQK